MTPSDYVLEKAARLLDEHRVVLSTRDRWCALVVGDTDAYHVHATPEGMTCDCWEGTRDDKLCSHAVAGMVALSEREAGWASFAQLVERGGSG